jgi:hypothetical protein
VHHLAVAHVHLRDRAGVRRRNRDRGLVGLDFHQRLILAHDVAGLDQHANHLAFMHAFAEIGEFELSGVHQDSPAKIGERTRQRLKARYCTVRL